MNSELALIFDTQDASLCIKWVTLKDKNRNYQMSIPSVITPRVFNLYCFGIIKIDTSAWKIFNTLSGTMVKVPKWIVISPHELRYLTTSFMTRQHSVSVALVHSHQVEPVVHHPFCVGEHESVV